LLQASVQSALVHVGVGSAGDKNQLGFPSLPPRAPLGQSFPQFSFSGRGTKAAKKTGGIGGHLRIVVVQAAKGDLLKEGIQVQRSYLREEGMVASAVAFSAGSHACLNARARDSRIDAQQIGEGGLLDGAGPLPDVLVDNRKHPRKNGGGGVALD